MHREKEMGFGEAGANITFASFQERTVAALTLSSLVPLLSDEWSIAGYILEGFLASFNTRGRCINVLCDRGRGTVPVWFWRSRYEHHPREPPGAGAATLCGKGVRIFQEASFVS